MTAAEALTAHEIELVKSTWAAVSKDNGYSIHGIIMMTKYIYKEALVYYKAEFEILT